MKKKADIGPDNKITPELMAKWQALAANDPIAMRERQGPLYERGEPLRDVYQIQEAPRAPQSPRTPISPAKPAPPIRETEARRLQEARQQLVEAAVHAKNLLTCLLAAHQQLNG